MSANLSIRCTIPSTLEDELPTILFGMPILGTEINDRIEDRTAVSVFLPGTEIDRVAETKSLITAAGGEVIEIAVVEDEDWMENYRALVQPFGVGATWWVDPHPDTPTPAPPGRTRLVVPPRMAFGSGSHESTRLLLEALEKTDLDGHTVLDVGTGSGILALASDARRAARVLAVDIDPVAVSTACQIRDLQEWRPGVHFVTGSADCAAGGLFDDVLCNMISAHFIPLFDAMIATLAPGGTLLLSGMLLGEADSLSDELERRGLLPSPMVALGEWASLRAERRG